MTHRIVFITESSKKKKQEEEEESGMLTMLTLPSQVTSYH